MRIVQMVLIQLSLTQDNMARIKKKTGNKICPAGKAWAMKKYGKWSAYAAMGASKYCKDPNYAKKDKRK